MYLKDTNMQAGVYVPILYSRGIELSWMLKSVAVRVMQQTGVVNNGPAVQADDWSWTVKNSRVEEPVKE